MSQLWELKKIPPGINISEFSDFFSISENILRLIVSRNITSKSEIRDFVNPHIGALKSPYLMDEMIEAVSLIKNSLNKKKIIGLFSDSDLDGITSLKILHYLLKKMGAEIHFRYPKNNETYGLTKNIIDELYKNGVGLLITSDSGIRDLDEISYARSLGMDVIITDHHEQGEILPDAIIINPKKNKCRYPYKSLAGVGVAFKLCHALLMSYIPVYNKKFILIAHSGDSFQIKKIENLAVIEDGVTDTAEHTVLKYNQDNTVFICLDVSVNDISKLKSSNTCYEALDFISSSIDGFNNIKNKSIESACRFLGINDKHFTSSIDLLERIFITVQLRASAKIFDFINYCMEFVAIGTIADVMPLIHENRIFVKLGLERMSNSSHGGISKLSEYKNVNSKFISWELSPVLNSPGRYGKTDITVDFFLENESSRERDIITELKELNEARKKLISETCTGLISDKSGRSLNVLEGLVSAKTEKIPDGMTGLVASKLSDYFGKPVIAVSVPGENGFCRGSGRCNGSYDFFSKAEKVSDKFIRFGGHAQAFGFTISYDKIDEMIGDLALLINHADYTDYNNKIIIDELLKLDEINTNFISSIKILEPFGKGNEEPLFLTNKIKPESFTRFGKIQNHGKFIINNKTNLTAIGWGMADNMEELFNSSDLLDIVYKLENNEYNNKTYPRMIISGIKKSY